MNHSLSRLAIFAVFLSGIVSAQTTAIVGGTVHTVGVAGTIENATVIIEGGIITAVGKNVAAPSGATIINAAGKVLTPGLFTPFGQLGLVEIGMSAGPLDAVQRGDQFTAGFDVADAFNPRSTLIAANRIEGVTRALIAPQSRGADESGNSSHVISGLAAVVNLGGGADSIDSRAAALVVNLGEGGRGLAGESRVSNLLVLRNALDEARDYRDNKIAFEQGQRREYQHSVADLESLQGVLSGDIPLLVNVHRAADMEALIRLTAEYGIRAVISGGTEAWMIAGQLAAAGIPVLMEPTDNLPSNFDRINARRDAAGLLIDAGVKIGFAGPASQTHKAGNMTQSAGNAVSEGLSWTDALRAITLAPAEIYGLADRLGSLEAGKEADIVIWPGDPLELTNYPEQVFIKGNAISMISRQTLLRDRYLQTGSGKPPAFRQ